MKFSIQFLYEKKILMHIYYILTDLCSPNS